MNFCYKLLRLKQLFFYIEKNIFIIHGMTFNKSFSWFEKQVSLKEKDLCLPNFYAIVWKTYKGMINLRKLYKNFRKIRYFLLSEYL